MKKSKTHRGHNVHKAGTRASAAGDSVDAHMKKHLIERGHGGVIDPQPEAHFAAAKPKAPKKVKPTRVQTSPGSGHETERPGEVPGVKLEMQQFIMQPPAILEKVRHLHPHLHHSSKRATYDRGA
jgi:hypothetical protein